MLVLRQRIIKFCRHQVITFTRLGHPSDFCSGRPIPVRLQPLWTGDAGVPSAWSAPAAVSTSMSVHQMDKSHFTSLCQRALTSSASLRLSSARRPALHAKSLRQGCSFMAGVSQCSTIPYWSGASSRRKSRVTGISSGCWRSWAISANKGSSARCSSTCS